MFVKIILGTEIADVEKVYFRVEDFSAKSYHEVIKKLREIWMKKKKECESK